MKILGWGQCLGETALSGAALEGVRPAGEVWMKTGILSRRRSTRSTAVLAAEALRQALALADREPAALILSTNSGDQWVPPTATSVARILGLRCPAFDLNAACAGGLYALRVAAGLPGPVAIVAAETVSRFCSGAPGDWCSVIFGDGAGAVVVETPFEAAWSWGTAPEGWEWMTVRPPEERGRMDGARLLEAAVPLCADALREAAAHAGVTVADLDVLVPHQANLRLLEALAARLGVPMGKVVTTVQHTGNLSSASLLVALATALEAGMVRDGHRIGLVAFGAGLTWGAMVGTVEVPVCVEEPWIPA